MIRLRRIPARGLFRRKRYEVEYEESGKPTRVVTKVPATVIDKYLGVGDAWALVHAADDGWNGESGEWVILKVND